MVGTAWGYRVGAALILVTSVALAFDFWNSRFAIFIGLPGEAATLLVIAFGGALALLTGSLGEREPEQPARVGPP